MQKGKTKSELSLEKLVKPDRRRKIPCCESYEISEDEIFCHFLIPSDIRYFFGRKKINKRLIPH